MGRNWKHHERQVAKLCGAERQPNVGRPQEDCSHPLFSFQVKHREQMPQWFLEALDQARGDANGKVPVVVFCLSSQGIKTRRFFLVDEIGWLDLHGNREG